MTACAPDFFRDGWCQFAHDPALGEWIKHALPAARNAVTDPAFKNWFRGNNTWFVGVNALANDTTGAVPGGPPLSGLAVSFINQHLQLSEFAWDRGQISVCYPGYPQADLDESKSAFSYRQKYAAAHIDGIKRHGPDRQRYIDGYHSFILGIPLVAATNGASPLVVWRGSHKIIQVGLQKALKNIAPQNWPQLDITQIYQTLRRKIFDNCERVIVESQPGKSYLLHRLALHGVMPWEKSARAGPDGRMIAYFRPSIMSADNWLNAA